MWPHLHSNDIPVLSAVCSKSRDEVESLLDLGAEVNARDHNDVCY